MDVLQQLLEAVRSEATANGMEVYITGASPGEGELEDGRLLKLCPTGLRTDVLIEIELHNFKPRIYHHRTNELTRLYRGRTVSQEWLRKFIAHNRELAQGLVEHSNANAAAASPSAAEAQQQPPRDARALKDQRLVVTCGCRGEVENCLRCFGSGSYTVDGYGNAV